jgi:hypothetical protein
MAIKRYAHLVGGCRMSTTRDQLKAWVEERGIPRVKIEVGESWGHGRPNIHLLHI